MTLTASVSETLPVVHVAEIPESSGPRWLVQDLWAEGGVGIVGGAPKCCKTWLALDVALSVASGTPALGAYAVEQPGPVLLFAAEDRPAAVRKRLEGLARGRDLRLEGLPLHAITTPTLRLDEPSDRRRLKSTIARFQPRLFVLDPFVRVQGIDENSAQKVSSVLGYLSGLQREHGAAIMVVHHARKASAGAAQGGAALRGSGDFHAWGESNLYLGRRHGDLEMVVEHRDAPSPEPTLLELSGTPPRLSIRTESVVPQRGKDIQQRVLQALAKAEAPIRQYELRASLRIRLERLVGALRDLEEEGRIQRRQGGWGLAKSFPSQKPQR